MTKASSRIVRPARNISGSLRLPGDKSISHRYAMLAAFAEGESRFQNFSTGADCASTLACVQALGAEVQRAGAEVIIRGCGGDFAKPAKDLDCGNSGSTMRMLAGLLAGQALSCRMVGDESLSRRPMARIIEPLTQMGAKVKALAEGNRPPLEIEGSRGLKGIRYKPAVASAQVKSSVVFAGLQAKGTTTVEEDVRTRDHGELALRAFGAEVERTRTSVSIEGGQKLRGIQAIVPGDISSASFFLCAAAIFPGSNLIFDLLLMNPTRAGMLDVIGGLGAKISVINLEEHNGELVGTVKVTAGKLRGAKIAGAQAAQLIDELPVLAAIAPFTEEGIEIRDAKELRVKESDRISAVAENLRAMGAEVKEHPDGISVPGKQRLHGAKVQSHHDHRIAMAFAVAALRAEGETEIQGADAAAISFPEFWEMLQQVAER